MKYLFININSTSSAAPNIYFLNSLHQRDYGYHSSTITGGEEYFRSREDSYLSSQRARRHARCAISSCMVLGMQAPPAISISWLRQYNASELKTNTDKTKTTDSDEKNKPALL